MSDVRPGDIVQLDPSRTENPMFGACLLVVTDAKAWGVVGYVQALGKNGEIGGLAYYRAEHGTFKRCESGRAVWWCRESGDDAD